MISEGIKCFFDGPQFRREVPLSRAGDIIRWWESRRVLFNYVVGGTGLLTCILMIVCVLIADSVVGEAIGMSDGPLLGLFGILFYAIFAYMFYTGGWIAELAARTAMTAERSSAFGLNVFRIGVTFSIFLTFCPAVLCWVAFAIAFLHGQTHGPSGE